MKRSLLRLSLAALLAATAWAGPAHAAGEPPADAPGVSAWQAGSEWIAGWIGDLVEPWFGGPDKDGGTPEARGRDGVTGTVGSGIDPSGITGNERPSTSPPKKHPGEGH